MSNVYNNINLCLRKNSAKNTSEIRHATDNSDVLLLEIQTLLPSSDKIVILIENCLHSHRQNTE